MSCGGHCLVEQMVGLPERGRRVVPVRDLQAACSQHVRAAGFLRRPWPTVDGRPIRLAMAGPARRRASFRGGLARRGAGNGRDRVDFPSLDDLRAMPYFRAALRHARGLPTSRRTSGSFPGCVLNFVRVVTPASRTQSSSRPLSRNHIPFRFEHGRSDCSAWWLV